MAGKGKLIGGIAVVVIAAAAVYGYMEYQKSSGGAAGKKIALSNNYAGNSWRQSMLKSWDKVTKQAVADGIVAEATPFTTSENQVTEQAAQIQNLILQGYDAIVLNAASPDALNGAVKEACDAGIIVVSFDGIVTEPCAWRIAVDFTKMGEVQLDYLTEKMPDGGNLLEIRGLAGVFVDDEIHKGIEDGVAEILAVQGRRLGPRRLDPDGGAEGGRGRAALAAGRGRGGDPGRRRLWRRAGLQGGRPADAAHHHGQPPGRARLVEGAEGRQRLRDHVGLDRARRLHARLLGGAADPRRQGSAEGHDRAVPAHRSGQPRSEPRRTPSRAASPTWNTRWKTRRR